MKKAGYKERYMRSISDIVHRGKGMVIILYNDGRGSGFAHRILDQTKKQHGIQQDARDFKAVAQLLKYFVNSKII